MNHSASVRSQSSCSSCKSGAQRLVAFPPSQPLRRQILITVLATTFFCYACGFNAPPPPNEVTFATASKTDTRSYVWTAVFPEVGLTYMLGMWTNIFCASDAAQSDDTFYRYLFLSVASDAVGIYHDDDGGSRITYYDDNGTLFMVFTTLPDTYTTIEITRWDDQSVLGTFEAVLSSGPPDYESLAVSGSIISFPNYPTNDRTVVLAQDWAADNGRALVEANESRRRAAALDQ